MMVVVVVSTGLQVDVGEKGLLGGEKNHWQADRSSKFDSVCAGNSILTGYGQPAGASPNLR